MTHKRSMEERKRKTNNIRNKQRVKQKAAALAKGKRIEEEEMRKSQLLQVKLNAARHQNEVLKEVLNLKRKRTETTNNFRAMPKTGIKSFKHLSQQTARKALVNFLPSMPVILYENVISSIKETGLKGTFGSLSIVKLKNLNNLVAALKTISLTNSTELDVILEAKVMHAVSGHHLFPYCFGFIRPNKIVSQFLGSFLDTGECNVRTVQNVRGTGTLNKYQWVLICNQIIEGICFLHGLTILHNDIKSDNIILYGSIMTNVKIIDFGKSTLISKPVVYNLNSDAIAKYNVFHRHLAYELRNVADTKQSVFTDTYSVGHLVKYMRYYEKFDFLYETGRKLKTEIISSRMSLNQASVLFQLFLKDYSF